MSGPPELTPEQWEAWLAAAEEDGWRPRETCECEEPEVVVLAGGDGYHISNVCGRCRRRLRRSEEQA